VRQISKANRASSRYESGFGKRKTDMHRHALSGYTWIKTNRSPQKSWLHHIGKAEDPTCPCGHTPQDGAHILFDCPRLGTLRGQLLGTRKTWEELDDPIWRKEEGDDSHWDAVEAFFDHIYAAFT